MLRLAVLGAALLAGLGIGVAIGAAYYWDRRLVEWWRAR